MHRRRFALGIAGIAGLPWALKPQAAQAASIGQPAPAFSVPDVTGRMTKLSDFKGRPVVLEWLNPGCPFVRKHYQGNMQALQREFTGRGVAWLSIKSTDMASHDYLPAPALAQWVEAQQASPTAVLIDEDGIAGRAMGARVTPHMFIIDTQGVLVYAGAIDSIASFRVSDINRATNFVRQGLNELLAGQRVSAPITQPYGCSIKFRS